MEPIPCPPVEEVGESMAVPFTRVVVPDILVPKGEIGLLEKARCFCARAVSTVAGVVVVEEGTVV